MLFWRPTGLMQLTIGDCTPRFALAVSSLLPPDAQRQLANRFNEEPARAIAELHRPQLPGEDG